MMKKMSALVLALVMVLVMGTTAFAATESYSGSNREEATGVAGTTAIPLTKAIVFFNVNGSTVYEPNISFSYEVTSDTAVEADGTTAAVTDGNDPAVTRNVYPGPDGGVTGTEIEFSTAKTAAASAAGVKVEESSSLGVNLSSFERPGIYRYLITETSSVAVTEAGLTARDADYDDTRYLDVYIRYNDSDALEMYGAVIFKSASDTPGQDSITVETKKTTGFEPTGEETSYVDDKNVDKYTTYDFTVKKTVSGSMADRNHEFPFYVAVSNSISGAKFTYTADGSETYTGMAVDEAVAILSAAEFSIGSDDKDSNLRLKHDDTIQLIGVPSSQTDALSVVIKEFNDTFDSYTPTASATHGELSMTAGTAMTALIGSDATLSFDVKANDGTEQILAIDNNLTEISPTGVVLRVAPYALMLGAGFFLLLVARKRKNSAEEA